MTWVYLFVALLPNAGATAYSVGFDNKETCVAYAQGHDPQGTVRIRECVGLRTGEIIDFKHRTNIHG